MARWRLYQSYFSAPGRYTFDFGKDRIEADVDENGVFEYPETRDKPLYAIAARVGSKRDVRYTKLADGRISPSTPRWQCEEAARRAVRPLAAPVSTVDLP